MVLSGTPNFWPALSVDLTISLSNTITQTTQNTCHLMIRKYTNPFPVESFQETCLNIYLFIIHIDNETVPVPEIVPFSPAKKRQKPDLLASPWSITRLLMSWRRKYPRHQQAWYGYSINLVCTEDYIACTTISMFLKVCLFPSCSRTIWIWKYCCHAFKIIFRIVMRRYK